MYLPTRALLHLTLLHSTLFLVTGAPIQPKTNAVTSRQVENFSSADDSGALYDLGTPVTGTDAWRDTNGVYHDGWKRNDGAAKQEGDAQVQEAVPAAKREVGDEVSAGAAAATAAAAPAGVLKALDKGEKVYF